MSLDVTSPAISISDVIVRYGAYTAISGVSLEVSSAEIHVLLGESGSGKTTLLRALGGFERLAGGSIRLAGAVADDATGEGGGVSWIPPERRRVGVVFQDYALFPHLSVAGNVSFGMKRADSTAVHSQLERVGITFDSHRMPGALSGGEQQRVALARALAQSPELMLLDEPFSNLNRSLRRRLRDETVALLRGLGVTTILVTHDCEEALAVADRISVIHGGRLLQTDVPSRLYDRPTHRAVAEALGEAELLSATRSSVDGRVDCVLGPLSCPGSLERGLAVVRPERVVVAPPDGQTEGVDATCLAIRFLGPTCEATLRLSDETTIRARGRFQDLAPPCPVRVWVEGEVALVPLT